MSNLKLSNIEADVRAWVRGWCSYSTLLRDQNELIKSFFVCYSSFFQTWKWPWAPATFWTLTIELYIYDSDDRAKVLISTTSSKPKKYINTKLQFIVHVTVLKLINIDSHFTTANSEANMNSKNLIQNSDFAWFRGTISYFFNTVIVIFLLELSTIPKTKQNQSLTYQIGIQGYFLMNLMIFLHWYETKHSYNILG